MSLIQTIGRAARNADGEVIMYADTVTGSMQRAIDETQRRRKIQDDYNKAHNITPKTIKKDIRAIIESLTPAEDSAAPDIGDVEERIEDLKAQMLAAAENLEFERAAELRDMIKKLQKNIKKGSKVIK